MPKQISTEENIKEQLLSGVNQLADTVKTTLGPLGRFVVVDKGAGSSLITNDGATIAKAIELEDREQNLGTQILKEVSAKTNELAGDGTTTATVLAQAMVRQGFALSAAGANPVQMKKGILGAAAAAAAALRKLSVPADTKKMLAQVASVASEDEAVGQMIADAMEKVGTAGIITVEESKGMETWLEYKEGMQWNRGFINPVMASDLQSMSETLNEPYILITDRKISAARELLPVLEKVRKTGRPLLLVADGVEKEALAMLIVNKRKGIMNVVAVRPPAYGENRKALMADLALLTGGTYYSEELGNPLEKAVPEKLGTASSVRIDRKNTVIEGGGGDKEQVAARVSELRRLEESTEKEHEKKIINDRIAKLTSGMAVIHVGAPTEAEMKGQKLLIEDAVHAARAAALEGVVPGGGIAYLNIRSFVGQYMESLSGDQKLGALALLRSLEAPACQILDNAGLRGSHITAEIEKLPEGTGYDVVKGEYTLMMEAGIIDPSRVARLALINAASACAILLTTEAGVTKSGD